MLTTKAEIKTAATHVEVMSGSWPMPIEQVWVDPRPVVTMLSCARGYETKGRFSDAEGGDRLDPIGHIFFIPPNRALYGWGTGGQVRATRCTFDPTFYERTLDGRNAIDSVQLRRCLDIRRTLLPEFLNRLYREAISPGFAGGALADSLGCAMLIEIARYALAAPDEPPRKASRLSRRQIEIIEDYIESLEGEPPCVSSLAALCTLSERQFCRVFREHAGKSAGRFLRVVQIERAKRLLANTDLPLKMISFRLGFANAANFSAAFRAATSLPPGMYRKQHDFPAPRTRQVASLLS